MTYNASGKARWKLLNLFWPRPWLGGGEETSERLKKLQALPLANVLPQHKVYLEDSKH